MENAGEFVGDIAAPAITTRLANRRDGTPRSTDGVLTPSNSGIPGRAPPRSGSCPRASCRREPHLLGPSSVARSRRWSRVISALGIVALELPHLGHDLSAAHASKRCASVPADIAAFRVPRRNARQNEQFWARARTRRFRRPYTPRRCDAPPCAADIRAARTPPNRRRSRTGHIGIRAAPGDQRALEGSRLASSRLRSRAQCLPARPRMATG